MTNWATSSISSAIASPLLSIGRRGAFLCRAEAIAFHPMLYQLRD
jgi:hypothetical protein